MMGTKTIVGQGEEDRPTEGVSVRPRAFILLGCKNAFKTGLFPPRASVH